MTIFTHHNVTFIVDTMDWYHSADAEVAALALEEGILSLSAEEVAALDAAWVDVEVECDLRNEGTDPITQKIEAIEYEAFSKATAGYARSPGVGHNCNVSIQR